MYIRNYTDVNSDVLLNCVPIFHEDFINYLREEKNENYTIITNNTYFLGELVLNKTAMQIIKLANGENNVGLILKKISNLYNNTDIDLITKDIVKILFDYSRINIMCWKGCNPFMNNFEVILDDNLKLTLAQEDDLLDIFNFHINFNNSHEYLNYLRPSVNPKEYNNQLSYREKLFSYSEEFFLLKREGIIEGIFSINLPIENYSKIQSTVAKISLISIKRELFNKELFTSMIKFAKDILKKESVCSISKIRFELINNSSDLNIIEEYLNAENFSNIVILPNEFSDKSVKYLDYIY